MRTDHTSPPRGRLANLATAAAVVLCIVLAVVWTRSGSAPAVQAPVPLADSGMGGGGRVVGEQDAGPDGADAVEEPAVGGALWRDGAGQGARRRRRADREEPARRKLRGRPATGRAGAAKRGRRTRRADRAPRSRPRGGTGPAGGAGGAGESVSAAPPAEAAPRRQDPPATAPEPAPSRCCAGGAAEPPPEFALG